MNSTHREDNFFNKSLIQQIRTTNPRFHTKTERGRPLERVREGKVGD